MLSGGVALVIALAAVFSGYVRLQSKVEYMQKELDQAKALIAENRADFVDGVKALYDILNDIKVSVARLEAREEAREKE